MNSLARRNHRLVAGLSVVVVVMVGLSYAAVPLYDLFCRVTGYGGTTQIAVERSATTSERPIKVRFDAMVTNIDWAFQPTQRQIKLKVGENALAFYRATNRSSERLTGTATFNVTPLKAGAYFNKVECFCFTEQTLAPGETIEMPVAFFVDREIDEDPNLKDVKTITLSYTFYPATPTGRQADEQQVSANTGPKGQLRSVQ
ncbi:MAG: Cytochrome c oxidase assembly protein CtaG [Alphaproteobacteria bacterium MarineAlpha4_Bin2]|nr:MAG: Cytochrome c oxidase assembly protein CtaG [Alphaproteobacteria bacterium MarineAlpha4_Bin2]